MVHVDYDDGDKEASVELERVRRRPVASGASASGGSPAIANVANCALKPGAHVQNAGSSPSRLHLKVGDAVVANYKGGGQWFPGKISSLVTEGVVNVEYDDGDKEEHVVEANIRRPPRSAKKRAPPADGDLVEGCVAEPHELCRRCHAHAGS